ncbi:hypothetical protein SAMN05428961_107187 [Paenibacillus sp. OK060]|nr:hypothetical protein SAMN05428961_107187 [Paenibacillus sp. OK060]
MIDLDESMSIKINIVETLTIVLQDVIVFKCVK